IGNFGGTSSGSGTGNGNGNGDGDGNGDGNGSDGTIDIKDVAKLLGPLLAASGAGTPATFAAAANFSTSDTLIQGLIRASASLNDTNILSEPNVLTADNEEAEIKVGNNIPLPASRVQSAAGIESDNQGNNLATSVNIERQDIGVTLRVTPQISEGDTVRLEIFQEITDVNTALSGVTGDPTQVGVSLSSRKVENTVSVQSEETVVIGGLVSDIAMDTNNKVPWLGDIPVLGWLFKTTGKQLRKINLLVFLTPHIVRNPADHEAETIRKREEFWEHSEQGLALTEEEEEEAAKRHQEALEAGLEPEIYAADRPVRGELLKHSERYPLERMRAIEEQDAAARRRAAQAEDAERTRPGYGVLAAVYRSEDAAAGLLTELVDAGYDGTVVATRSGGSVLYEIRLGPYRELEDAQRTAEAVAGAFGLSPTVVIGDGAPGAEPERGDTP